MNRDIELWTVDTGRVDYEFCRRLLDQSEIEKMEQFRIQKVSKQYVMTRGVLRELLSSYLNVSPRALKFERSQYGKPYLAGEGERGGVVFNLSHSGERLAVAIGFGMQLGVDIERWRENLHFSELVERYFAVEEVQYWSRLPAEDRRKAFYELWTKKEAFVKAVGRGIALGLDRCVVSCYGAGRFNRIPEEYGSTDGWTLIDLDMPEGYSGALAVDMNPVRLIKKSWRYID